MLQARMKFREYPADIDEFLIGKGYFYCGSYNDGGSHILYCSPSCKILLELEEEPEKLSAINITHLLKKTKNRGLERVLELISELEERYKGIPIATKLMVFV